MEYYYRVWIRGNNCVLGVISGHGKTTLTVYLEWYQVKVKQR